MTCVKGPVMVIVIAICSRQTWTSNLFVHLDVLIVNAVTSISRFCFSLCLSLSLFVSIYIHTSTYIYSMPWRDETKPLQMPCPCMIVNGRGRAREAREEWDDDGAEVEGEELLSINLAHAMLHFSSPSASRLELPLSPHSSHCLDSLLSSGLFNRTTEFEELERLVERPKVWWTSDSSSSRLLIVACCEEEQDFNALKETLRV